MSLGILGAMCVYQVEQAAREEDRKRLMEMTPEDRACELELRRIRAIENAEPPQFSIFGRRKR